MRHTFNETADFTDDMPFGELVRKKRRLMGYNQEDFADWLGFNQGTISRWELGETSPQIEDARYILKRLGFRIVFEKTETEE